MMDKHSSSASDFSVDSLEKGSKKKSHRKKNPCDENVDTILVPFYENDVLIKVPKDQAKKQESKSKKDSQSSNSYLIKKDVKKTRRITYLEIFRKQFSPVKTDKKKEETEIRSISPEYGDTERESFGEDDNNNPASEFYNTESYNEIFYDKILNQEIENYLENSFDEGLRFEEKALRSESPEGSVENNLKSVSEVSQPRRHARRATVQPIQNVKLGGLGPDMETIKPRLERARSLQRYSEKVRMENRLRIYKKSVQADIEMKTERQMSARHRGSAKENSRDEQSASYLVNKSQEEKSIKKLNLKSKSAGAQKTRERNKAKDLLKDERTKTYKEEIQNSKQQKIKETEKAYAKTSKRERKKADDGDAKNQSVRSSARNRGINTEQEAVRKEIPPVQISFLVNVGGIRPSSALKTLEEKHRMYQEQVKAFTMDNNNI